MTTIKNNKVYTSSETYMEIEQYKQFQLDNMKMYCSMMIDPIQAESKQYASERISNIQNELVTQFGYTWDEMEVLEIQFYNVA